MLLINRFIIFDIETMVEIFQNIRQFYAFAAPCEELMDYVEFYSESNVEKTQLYAGSHPFSVKMFASWTPTFYINLGEPYTISLNERRYNIDKNSDILILRDGTVERHNQPKDNIFTVKFYPGGLKAILNIDQTKCVNTIIPLNEILPQDLLSKIKKQITFEERKTLIQNYLLSQYSRKLHTDHYLKLVNQAIGEYTTNGFQLNTGKIAQNIFLTSKTTSRYFNRVIGLSPKSYFSILRARTALTAYIVNGGKILPSNFGYYDHSHFGKEVKRFTGLKLTDSNL